MNNIEIAKNRIIQAKLKKSIELDLQGLDLTSIPLELFELTQLIKLDLRSNQIDRIPSDIAKLTNLQILYLGHNVLKTLPEQIIELKNLTDFGLAANEFKYININLSEFINLEALSLGVNSLNVFPLDICRLEKLKRLYIEGNNIKKLPVEILNLKNLELLSAYENPINTPPIEIVYAGIDAIREYFSEIQKSEIVKLFETKLLIVGHGAVGKTSLMNRLIYNTFSGSETSTEGIDINSWEININEDKKLKINIWDFGGQEIYYSTHQFFLSKRSLYILVWDARIEIMMPNLTSFDYWLSIVSLLSNNSPIIIVQNKIDERERSIAEDNIQKNFKNVVGFYKVSAKDKSGINELTERIKNEIEKLPHIGEKLPKVWIDIRNNLKQINKDYINFNEYTDICKSFQIETEQALFLSNYFHDLGIFLHFQNNDILRNIIFLNPEWATNAVYKIIDTKEIIKNHGKFNQSELKSIWKNYPEDKFIHLIELMKKFELCFQIPNSNDFIVPEMLPSQKPVFEWNYEKNARFEFRYNFMPSGIITRFIVRMHDYIKDSVFWKNGVEIEREKTYALIESDIISRKVNIWLRGENIQDLFTIIKYEINNIHKTLQQPDFKLMTPCICTECITNEKPNFYSLETLDKALEKGIKTIQCQQSFTDIPINKLLGRMNGNGEKHILYDYILIALKQLQGLAQNIQHYEDSRNSFIANVLTNKGFRVKDQTFWGISKKKSGEIDIKIENEKGDTIAICEAFNLEYIDTNKIENHILKLFDYDANGLHENYILIYNDKNFIENWNKYKELVLKINYLHKIKGFTDISSNQDINTNIKVGIALHERNEKQIKIFHIMIEMIKK